MGSYRSAKTHVAAAWPEQGQEPAKTGDYASFSIGELTREFGVSPRALRFYQAKGLLTPMRSGRARWFSAADRERLALILQAKRMHFTLIEARDMLATWRPGGANLPISRRQCVEQIKLLEKQRREIEGALRELRRIYTGMSNLGAMDRPDPDDISA